jgi:methyl-accepting chemotaxis protein
MGILGRLKLWQKLAALVAVVALPAAILGSLYLQKIQGELTVVDAELTGTRYVKVLNQLHEAVLAHRQLAVRLSLGDQTQRSAWQASQTRLSQLISELSGIDAELGTSYSSTAKWRPLKAALEEMAREEPGADVRKILDSHAAVLEALPDLMGQVSMASGLALDPDAMAYAWMIAITERLPRALNELGNLRLRIASAEVKGATDSDRDAATLHHRLILSELSAMAVMEQEASKGSNASGDEKLKTLAAERTNYRAFFDTMYRWLNSKDGGAAAGAEVSAQAEKISQAVAALGQSRFDALMVNLADRRQSLQAFRLFSAATAIVSVLLVIFLTVVITRSLARPLTHAIQVFDSIAAGRYDTPIENEGRDEVSEVLSALSSMQGKLKGLIENERAVALTNSRIKQALDSVTACVMVADADSQIIYTNPAMDSMLRIATADFHAHQRRMVEGLRGPHREQIEVGGHTFSVVLTPVIGADGERRGTVLEWADRTQETAVEKELQQILSAVLAGDLARRINAAGKVGFFQTMARGVNQLADNMAEVVSSVKTAAIEVSRGADEISQGNAHLSKRTEQQSSSLESTASSMEEMTSTVKQNAANASQATQLAMAARDQAEKGGQIVGRAVEAMAGISEFSNKIAAIIGVIDEIAFQTNLLALNAAVEAARAGEQGRGFAVVASEVRSLAGRSATAAKEIKDLIQDSVARVDSGSTLVLQSGESLREIVVAVKKVSDIISEIAAASREQSVGIDQVNKAVMEMDGMTQQNAALVEQASAASEAMASQARDLNLMMDRYSVDGANASKPRSGNTLSIDDSPQLLAGAA